MISSATARSVTDSSPPSPSGNHRGRRDVALVDFQGDAAHRQPGDAGYRRFLADPKGEGFAIDPAKVEADARFDGVFVLRTNTKLTPLRVVLQYRNLLAVEQGFLG